MKIFALYLCILAVVFTGCRNQKWCTNHFPCPEQTSSKEMHDTVYIPHDSIITIPADNSSLFAWIYCDSLNNALIRKIDSVKTGRPKITIGLHDNRLTVNCECDSMKIALKWNERHTSDKFYETKIERVTTNVLTRWQSFLIVLGYGGLIALCLLIIYTAYRIWRKLKV